MTDSENVYPLVAGHKGTDTAIEAAEAITPSIGRLQRMARDAIAAAGERGLTADELADRLGLTRWSIQPRTSELRRLGQIFDSGIRRRNVSGKRAIVWRLAGAYPEFAEVANG